MSISLVNKPFFEEYSKRHEKRFPFSSKSQSSFTTDIVFSILFQTWTKATKIILRLFVKGLFRIKIRKHEAVIDEEGTGGQCVVRVHALLDAAPHVVVPEGQAVCPIVRLDHPVLAIPYLRPAAGGVHWAVGHRAVQVVGEGKLSVVLGGGGVLVQAVRRILVHFMSCCIAVAGQTSIRTLASVH